MRKANSLQGWRSRPRSYPAASALVPIPTAIAPAAPSVDPTARRQATASPTEESTSRRGRLVAFASILLLALIAARVAEIIPFAYKVRPSLIAAILGGLIVVTQTSDARFNLALRNPIVRYALFYAGWAAVTAPFALWRGYAIASLYPVLTPVTVMVLVLAINEPTLDTLNRLTRGFIVAVGAHLLVLIVMGTFEAGRLSGTDSLDPNDLASLAALTFPLALMQSSRGGALWRAIGVLVAMLTVYVLLQSGSRGGTIAFAGAIVGLVLASRGPKRGIVIAVVVLSIPVAWAVAPSTFRERISSMANLEEDYNTFDYYGRKQVWRRGLGYVIRNPVMGVGLNNFDTAEGLTLAARGERGKWSSPHSAYIQAFSELGLVGGAIFVTLLVTSLRLFWGLAKLPDARERRPEYFASLLGFMCGAIFLAHAYFWALYGLFGLAALTWAIHRRRAESRRPAVRPTAIAAPAGGTRGWRRGR
jgi:hypothetical protein